LSDIRRFLENQIDPLQLARLMEQVEEQGLDHANLLAPETPGQALLLLQAIPHSVTAAQMASRLLRAYSGPTTPAMWREIVRAALRPTTILADLVKRWPRLVVSALLRRQDGIAWVLELGTFADEGLIAAVRDRRAVVRERAMEVLERGGGSRRRRVESAVRAMAEEDESLRESESVVGGGVGEGGDRVRGGARAVLDSVEWNCLRSLPSNTKSEGATLCRTLTG
jgi:hypothetical protein